MKNTVNIDDLKASPLFNLSLSSKELFHSNFLIWLCEQFPEELGKLFAKKNLIFEEILPNKIREPKREDKNIDLAFKINDIRFIFENKVKSLPNKQQLEFYREKFGSKCIYILLSFVKPNFNLNDIGWELMSYNDLSILLKQLVKQISSEKNYAKFLILDYISFIDNLSLLLKSLKISSLDELFNYYNNDYASFYKIRIHDLYIKHRYSQLLVELKNHLEIKGLTNITISERYQGLQDKIVLSFNLVNGKGVINIDFSYQPGITIGIMLDELKYIHYVHTEEKKGFDTKEIATDLRNKNLWFWFDSIDDSLSYPRKGKHFNKFGTMLYRSIKINANNSIRDVFEKIYLDLVKLKSISNTVNKP